MHFLGTWYYIPPIVREYGAFVKWSQWCIYNCYQWEKRKKLVKRVRKQGGETYLSSQHHVGCPPHLLLHAMIDHHQMPCIERHVIYQYVDKQNICLILLFYSDCYYSYSYSYCCYCYSNCCYYYCCCLYFFHYCLGNYLLLL